MTGSILIHLLMELHCPLGVYMVAHSSADPSLTAIANETRTLYHNGDDTQV